VIWTTYERLIDDREAPASELHSPDVERVTLTGTVAINDPA
jgi:hypothetical protein